MNRFGMARRSTKSELLAAACLLFVFGCAPSPLVRLSGPAKAAAAASRQDRICILTPADGRFESKVYEGTGQIVASRIVYALRADYADLLVLNPGSESDAKVDCGERGGRYLVVPAILHWEERATGWSGLPDHIEIQVSLRDLTSGTTRQFLFDAQTSMGVGGFLWAAFFEWGNLPASRLLDARFDRAVVALLSGQEP